MMRWPLFASMTLVLMLAGCFSQRTGILERMFDLALGQLSDEAVEVAPQPTRDQLSQIPFAMIALSRPGSEARGFIVPVADTGGYVVYQDPFRRSVVLNGAQMTGTYGFGYDLAAVKGQLDDPIAVQRPVRDWPSTLVRNYQFKLQNAPHFEITVQCVLEFVSRETIEIVELSFDLAKVQERCSNAKRTFENTYWADPATGYIWKSQQWIGPKVEPFIIEVIRPYKST